MPRPRVAPSLKDDLDLATTFQDENSLTFIQAQLAERRKVEAQGQEFMFAPLMVTLENMLIFIKHIEEGKQFTGTLIEEETAALKRIGQQTAKLVSAQQPRYKRTLRLALSLTILCDIITQRLVINPLLEQQPWLSEKIFISNTTSSLWSDYFPGRRQRLMAALPLTGKHGSGGEQALPKIWFSLSLYLTLFETINNQNLLLYPSFHPLTIADFCRLGHLPLFPVGLMTEYVMGADGQLRTPLPFAEHDLTHMEDMIAVGDPDYRLAGVADVPLYDSARRLDWRRLLLDRIPRCLTDQLSLSALQLLLFDLLHEKDPDESVRSMSSDTASFPRHIKTLVGATSVLRHTYEDTYKGITTGQAAIAILWAMRLWSCWRAADCQLSEEELHACARAFIDKDLPRLDQHLNFFAQHRSRLRQLFAEHPRSHARTFNNRYAFASYCGPDQLSVTFFVVYDPDTGLHNLDMTDVVYFYWLCCATDRRAIEERICVPLPEGTASEPDTPVDSTWAANRH